MRQLGPCRAVQIEVDGLVSTHGMGETFILIPWEATVA
jgi:hypothetical protein